MAVTDELVKRTQERFLMELRRHFLGWFEKFKQDLSEERFESEIKALQGDPLYSAFGLASAEYALVRMMGRISISIGRRLGEIYDKLPRFVTQARFKLDSSSVAPVLKGLELDVCIPLQKLGPDDRKHVESVADKYIGRVAVRKGLAIEIRYNFNPNDSARLRKDVLMAELLEAADLVRVYLIFSSISPRDEAIARLKRAGRTFLVGEEAANFMRDLVGMDIETILQSAAVKEEVKHEMARIMAAIYGSYAVRSTLSRHSD
jgi:hypothetical protein